MKNSTSAEQIFARLEAVIKYIIVFNEWVSLYILAYTCTLYIRESWQSKDLMFDVINRFKASLLYGSHKHRINSLDAFLRHEKGNTVSFKRNQKMCVGYIFCYCCCASHKCVNEECLCLYLRFKWWHNVWMFVLWRVYVRVDVNKRTIWRKLYF